MAISAAGRKKFAAFGVVLVMDFVVFFLALKIDIFQGFFFVADLFSLMLAITTLAFLLLLIMLDLTSSSNFLVRPVFEVPCLIVLTIAWFGGNIFSSIRWSNVPFACSSIPSQSAYEGLHEWCRNLGALRIMIWMVWAALFILTSTLVFIVNRRFRNGDEEAWRTPLTRIVEPTNDCSSEFITNDVSSFYRGSSAYSLQNFGGQVKVTPLPSPRDYFAPPPRVSLASSTIDPGKAGVGSYPGYEDQYFAHEFKGPDRYDHEYMNPRLSGFRFIVH